LLNDYRKEGVPAVEIVRDLPGAGISKSDNPETVGRAIARQLLRAKASKGEKS